MFVFLISGSLYGNELSLFISGYVFKDSICQPVPDHVVLLKFKNQYPPYLLVKKMHTDSSGYFSFYADIPVTKGVIQVSTVDCNNEIITRNLPFNALHTNLNTNFSICYNPTLAYCRSDFVYVIDSQEPGKVIFKQSALGKISNWIWDFGDGTTSVQPDPIHYYQNEGIYEVCLNVSDSTGAFNDTHCELIEIKSDTVCQAYYTSYARPGTENTLQFRDLSYGSISEWNWDFGDGTQSDQPNPEHTFPQPGTYQVSLTVSNSMQLCTDTYSHIVEVHVSSGCSAGYLHFRDPVEPLRIIFRDNSQGSPDVWLWDFGDGTTSTQQNPVHAFAEEGTYHVCLTATNQETGNQDSYCGMLTIDTDPECTAFFRQFEMSRDPYGYQFVDQSPGDVAVWEWDFGDGTTSGQQNPVHTYNTTGAFDVCLTVSDDEGRCQDAYCETLYVGVPPACQSNFYSDRDTLAPLTFHFTNASLGNINGYQWDFGDGKTSTQQNPTHTYTGEGIYMVCLTANSDSAACSDIACREIAVTADLPCQARFDQLIYPEDPLKVQFIDHSTGDADLWIWDFGDGTTAFEPNPTHTFDQEGNYSVSLLILDINTGTADQYCKNIEVSYNPSCDADFEFIPSISDPQAYRFINRTTGDIAQWQWDFGDGTTSAAKNPVHYFTDRGTYPVCLQVTNVLGNCTDQQCYNVFIDIPELCSADFGYQLSPEQPLQVTFTDQSEGNMTSWQWSFGDGMVSSNQNPVHQYAEAGTYNVSLSISNPDSLIYCSDSISKTIGVVVPAPACQAAFTAAPDSGVNHPYLFHFRDASTGAPDAWHWDFGDGATSVLQNPNHRYDTSGNYEVQLVITKNNPYGPQGSDSVRQTLQMPEYFHFGGFVYGGRYPINNPNHQGDTAEIFLYRNHENGIASADTSRFTELGYFFGLNLLADNYLIKSRLTPGSAHATEFFPTYFGDDLNWKDAQTLVLTDSSHYHTDIHLQPLPAQPENGTGTIGGIVMLHTGRESVISRPAADAEVLLYNSSLEPLTYAYTRTDGTFAFGSLPFGTYYLQAEVTGMFCEPMPVDISPSSPGQTGIQLDLYTEDITGIADQHRKSHFSIYPNPAKDILNIRFFATCSSPATISIINSSGAMVKNMQQQINTGYNHLHFDISTLPDGLYVIRILSLSDGSSKTGKFLKK